MVIRYPLFGLTGADGNFTEFFEDQVSLHIVSGLEGFGTSGYVLTDNGDNTFSFTPVSGTVGGDHSTLTNLDADDHTDYHNDTRGDARYLYFENTTPFTPDADYEPATKKYVDDNAGVGPTGETGPSGATGDTGPAGSDGAAGEAGPSGASGDGFEYKGSYAAGSDYVQSDVVADGGSTYVAIQDAGAGNSPSDGSYWSLWALSGDQGDQGIQGVDGPAGAAGTGETFTWRGEWSSLSTYLNGDVVGSDGSSYIATGGPAVGDAPDDVDLWDLMARSGAAGSDADVTAHASDTTIHFTTDHAHTGYATTGDVDVLGGSYQSHADDSTIHFVVDHAHTGYATTGDLDVHAGDPTIHFTEASIIHANIAGLTVDDHPHYHNDVRGDLRYTQTGDFVDHTGDSNIHFPLDHSHTGYAQTGHLDEHAGDLTVHFTEASISHSNIADLGVDDHTMYHTDARGDARYTLDADFEGLSGDFIIHSGDASVHFTLDHAHTGYATTGDLDVHAGDADIHYSDATADGNEYTRKDNAWTLAAGGDGAPQSPLTGNLDLSEFHLVDGINEVIFWSGTPENKVYIKGSPAFELVETSLATGDYIYYDGAEYVNHAPVIYDMSDVVLTSVVSGHGLYYDGAEWINSEGIPGPTGSALGNRGVIVTSPETDDDFGIFPFELRVYPYLVKATLAGVPGDDSVVHFNLKFGPDRGAPASGLFPTEQACTSTGAGTDYTTFEHSYIEVGDHLSVAITGATASIKSFELFIFYTEE